ncbi:pre-mRNA-splicing regulator WTAP isoform X1 [Bombus vosnesenskii]|uniref:Pre-mRNA-splicing regulator WTAP isoform X1 n=2 Tax=Pyrobombus TaxID=144703 RepID=A0A6J3K813_9HYME|nr:pre-mRNA-splicing regulator WTAP isoform X1 [Bombus vancouverensis nearcticus]XP_033190211.1 pre-mRNA-splicing regulator WTAP isoform X1 [Bombus vancouverensis nearcticus]XP_033314085.1 pre-mRNA-splicing regulator WTAP isoform X1 [Bombus bifarius]XP_033314086.1 pre-mRNA-splicing regulator WTAP isoform X1 [Bombus bifarius]XP_033348794.1 pre-mRNA-splicing regulator WTAP isoform X1 [Bombus vosnesenskii]XP_033348795.1 pre-mRNA-splicing regulator WTAP isoform X1 [Bombus vosnesenskii]XP_04359442
MAEECNDVKSAGPSSPRSPQNNSMGGKPSSPHSPRQPRRMKLTQQQLDSMTKDELAAKWHEQDLYVECLEAQAAAQEGELSSLRDSESKYRQQHAEASHREKILVRRLASKEQELQEYISQIAEMKAAHAPSAVALRSALLDPAVNILIQKLRQELVTTKAKLEDTQNELSAWKFTPDSNTGKRLMAKCRLLYQENEELGRMIASGRIAKLEGDLALQRSFSEEMKKSQSELDEFLQDLDEDVEGMQSTIYFLQQELRKARESVTLLQQENAALKANSSENNLTNGLSPHTPPIKKEESEENSISETKTSKSMEDSDVCKGARTPPLSSQRSPQCEFSNTERTERVERKPNQADHNDESSSDSAALIIKVENEELSDREEEHEENRNNKRILRSKSHNRNNNKTNGEEVLTRITRGRDRTKRDKSAPGSDDERTYKKKRRESILSLDYNEADDDALVLTNGETLQSDPE